MQSVDTNVLVYALLPADPRATLAARLIEETQENGGPLALQTLGELGRVCFTKLKMTAKQVETAQHQLLVGFDTIQWGESTLLHAVALAGRYRLQYWDAMLIATLAEHGVRTLYTEDMQDGATYAGVRVVNPFGAGVHQDRAEYVVPLAKPKTGRGAAKPRPR